MMNHFLLFWISVKKLILKLGRQDVFILSTIYKGAKYTLEQKFLNYTME